MNGADPSRGRGARKRRAVERPIIRPTGGLLDGLLDNLRAELREALRAEGEAAGRLRDLRRGVASVIARAVAAGVPYDLLAIATLRARLGRAPTVGERLREARRLKKRNSRFLVTASHPIPSATALESPPPDVAWSERKEAQKTMAQRLVKRVVEEHFVDDGEENLGDVEGAEDLDEEETEESDEGETETTPVARRPRKPRAR